MMRRSISLVFCLLPMTIPIIYGSNSLNELPDLETFNPEEFYNSFSSVQSLEDSRKLKVYLPDGNRERSHPYKTSKSVQNKPNEYNTDQSIRNYSNGLLYQEHSQYCQLGTMNYEEGVGTSMFDSSANEFICNYQGNQHDQSFIYGRSLGVSVHNIAYEQLSAFNRTINSHTKDYRYGFYNFKHAGTSQETNLNMSNNINSTNTGHIGLSNCTTNVDPTVYKNPVCDETMVKPIPFSYDSIINDKSNSFNNAKLNEMILDILLYRLKCNDKIHKGNSDEKLRILNSQLTVWDNMAFCEDIVNILEAFNLTLPELDFIKDQANKGTMPLDSLLVAVDKIITTPSVHLYGSFNFLYILFSNKHNTPTYKSIEAALSPVFFHSLSTDQFIDAMECILDNGFNLGSDDVKKVIEVFFGYIDCSPNMKLHPNDICRIIKVILASNNPDSFECVYLTWRMWGVVTCEQQVEIMNLIQELPEKLPRETFIMLYLFILNPIGGENVNPEGLSEWFINEYKKVYPDTFEYKKEDMENVCSHRVHFEEMFDFFSMPLNGSLMYFPDILQNSKCCDNIQLYFSQYTTGKRLSAKYSLHILYAFVRHRKSGAGNKTEDISSFWAKFCMSAKSFCNKIEDMKISSQYQNSSGNHCIQMKTVIGQFRLVMQDRRYNISIFENIFANLNSYSNNKALFLTLTFIMLSSEFVEKYTPRIMEIINSKTILNKYSTGAVCIKNLQEHCHKYVGAGLSAYVRFLSHIFYKKSKNIRNKSTREEYIYRYLTFNPEINIVREFLEEYITGVIFKNKTTECKAYFRNGIHDLFWSDYYYNAFLNVSPAFIKALTFHMCSGKYKDRFHRLCVEFNNENKEVRKMIKAIFKCYRKTQN
ncbi:hypothetical protein PAEPH01_0425 [Pancytospora epiphaga]|nr:hypothetical protein PAEPH01_0425 [Pancytospora epiphaga]